MIFVIKIVETQMITFDLETSSAAALTSPISARICVLSLSILKMEGLTNYKLIARQLLLGLHLAQLINLLGHLTDSVLLLLLERHSSGLLLDLGLKHVNRQTKDQKGERGLLPPRYPSASWPALPLSSY